MIKNKHVVICPVGRTASGKTELTKKVAKDLGLTVLKSYATRSPRKDEIDNSDVDHIFITNDVADEMLNDSEVEIVAYTEINNNRYFATLNQLRESDFYIIDPLGYKTLSSVLKERNITDIEVIPLYIGATYDIRKERYLKRDKATIEDFKSRDLSEDTQFTFFELKTSVLSIDNNDSFEESVKQYKNIVKELIN